LPHTILFSATPSTWLRRLDKKERGLTPCFPGPADVFAVERARRVSGGKDFGKLVITGAALLKPDGVLLASTNASDWEPEDFLADVETRSNEQDEKILQRHYAPQPPDFSSVTSRGGVI